jgi:uncharacterized protein (DUF983 family)
LILLFVVHRRKYSKVFSYVYWSEIQHNQVALSGVTTAVDCGYKGRCPKCDLKLEYGYTQPISGKYQCTYCDCVYSLSGD